MQMLFAFYPPSRPTGRTKERRRSARGVGWSAPLLLVLEGWGHGPQMRTVAKQPQNRGFPRGAAVPPWHTTLLARYSVLYLLARLTGEAGGGAVCPPLAPAGKQAGVL